MRTGWRVVFSVVVVFLTLAAGGLVGFIAGQVERDDAFVIDTFEQHITIAPDTTPTVEERIAVTFTEQRRGIFRDLDERAPFPTTGGYGDIEVTGAPGGGAWNFALERYEHGPRIRIGEANTWLQPGRYLYEISYSAPSWTIIRRDAPEFVELRIDTPGYDWPTTIGATTVTIDLPAPAVEVACVEGPRRSTRPCEHEPQITGDTVLARLGPFEVGEAATIAVLLPAEAFTVDPPVFRPPPLDRSRGLGPWEVTTTQAGLLVAIVLVLPLLVWELVSARVHYRDRVTDPYLHDRATPTALPAPPHGFRPPEVAGLLLRIDQQDLLLSAIVDLEQRGLLRSTSSEEASGRWFSRTRQVLTLERPPSGTVLPPGDDEVLHALVPSHGPTVFDGEYDRAVAGRVEAAGKLLSERASGVYRDHGFTHDDSGLLGEGTFLVAASLAWIAFAAAVVRVVASATPLPGAAAIIVAAIVVAGYFLAHAPWAYHRKPLNSEGRDARAQAEAFDHFVSSVEGDQLDWAAGQDSIDHHHPALTLLPYAIALGHADSWYARFGPVIEALTTVPSSGGTTRTVGTAGAAWWASSSSFGNVRTSQAGTSTAPSSSGGSGGGGSGGGGGGGGSW